MTTSNLRIALVISFFTLVILPLPSWADDLADRRDALDQYLSMFDNASARFVVKEIEVRPGNRVQEITHKGEWKSSNGRHRSCYHSETISDGKTELFDIKDVLWQNNKVLIWSHPGFPGELQVCDRLKSDGGRRAQECLS